MVFHLFANSFFFFFSPRFFVLFYRARANSFFPPPCGCSLHGCLTTSLVKQITWSIGTYTEMLSLSLSPPSLSYTLSFLSVSPPSVPLSFPIGPFKRSDQNETCVDTKVHYYTSHVQFISFCLFIHALANEPYYEREGEAHVGFPPSLMPILDGTELSWFFLFFVLFVCLFVVVARRTCVLKLHICAHDCQLLMHDSFFRYTHFFYGRF